MVSLSTIAVPAWPTPLEIAPTLAHLVTELTPPPITWLSRDRVQATSESGERRRDVRPPFSFAGASGRCARYGVVWAVLICGWMCLGGCVSRAHGSDDAEAAVQQGQRALKSQSRLPWYDTSHDELKSLSMRPHKLAKPVVPLNWPNWSLPDWLADTLAIIVKIVFYVLVAALLVGIAYLLVKTIRGRRAAAATKEVTPEEDERLQGQVDGVENLPFPLPRPRGDLLSEAQRCYDEGDYSGAIIYLYSYELLQMDRHRLIELAQGKTNRQYLREVRSIQRLAPLIESTMVTFEDAFFGRYAIPKDRFESCWNRLNEFHQLVGGEATT